MSPKRSLKRNVYWPRATYIGYGLYVLGLILLAFRATRLAAAPVLYYACKAILRGRKLRAESADELLARDPRPPVLYLRSFLDDQGEAEGSEYKRGLMLPTLEEHLALAFNRIGPFVAIGRPGEELPELGAARLRLAAEEWQGTVLELIRRSRLVVVHLGSTGGLWWEVEQALATVELQRLVFFVPLGGGPMYERLAALVRKWHGIGIPEIRPALDLAVIGQKRPPAHFLFFDRSQKPHLAHVWPTRWQKGIYSERGIRRALNPLLEELGIAQPALRISAALKWAALFLLPALILRWTFSAGPRIRQAEEKVAVAQAKLGVYTLNRNLARLQQQTGALPAMEWMAALERERLIPPALMQGYKTRGVIADPWGFPYGYRRPGIWNPDGFDVFSLGADGKPGGPQHGYWELGSSGPLKVLG